jgi:hypothetical protein
VKKTPKARWIYAGRGLWNFKVPRVGCRFGFIVNERWGNCWVAHRFGLAAATELFGDAKGARMFVEARAVSAPEEETP